MQLHELNHSCIASILHPAGLGLLSWSRTAKTNRVMLTLLVAAAIPLSLFAFANFNLQTAGGAPGFFHNPPAFHGGTDNSVPEDSGDIAKEDEPEHDEKHSAAGHYRNMAAFSFIVILLGLLASFRPPGWRIAAWIAGFLSVFLGLASAALPGAESSIGVVWGLAAIGWGISFIAAAEFFKDSGIQTK